MKKIITSTIIVSTLSLAFTANATSVKCQDISGSYLLANSAYPNSSSFDYSSSCSKPYVTFPSRYELINPSLYSSISDTNGGDPDLILEINQKNCQEVTMAFRSIYPNRKVDVHTRAQFDMTAGSMRSDMHRRKFYWKNDGALYIHHRMESFFTALPPSFVSGTDHEWIFSKVGNSLKMELVRKYKYTNHLRNLGYPNMNGVANCEFQLVR